MYLSGNWPVVMYSVVGFEGRTYTYQVAPGMVQTSRTLNYGKDELKSSCGCQTSTSTIWAQPVTLPGENRWHCARWRKKGNGEVDTDVMYVGNRNIKRGETYVCRPASAHVNSSN